MDLASILASISQYLSITFILIVNIVTYFLIKFGEKINGVNVLTKTQKKAITFGVIVLCIAIFHIFSLSTLDVVILSSLLTPYTYNYIMRHLLKTLKVPYNQADTEII